MQGALDEDGRSLSFFWRSQAENLDSRGSTATVAKAAVSNTTKSIMPSADGPRCKCGQEIRYPNHVRCEDCFSDDQERWSGKSQRVDTTSWHKQPANQPQENR